MVVFIVLVFVVVIFVVVVFVVVEVVFVLVVSAPGVFAAVVVVIIIIIIIIIRYKTNKDKNTLILQFIDSTNQEAIWVKIVNRVLFLHQVAALDGGKE